MSIIGRSFMLITTGSQRVKSLLASVVSPLMGVVFFFQILSTVLCLYHLFVVAFVHLFHLGHGRGRDREVWSLH